MPTQITTSTASTPTAYSNQRKLDRTQNGNLWAIFWDGTSTTTTSMRTRYSTDNGATWTDPGTGSAFGFAGTGTTYIPNTSWFIDLDDYAHVVYKDRHAGTVWYRRGTPNAGRTAWTWSAATVVQAGETGADYPDLIVHREGTGWVAHVVYSWVGGGANNRTYYHKVTIASDGTPTIGAQTDITTDALVAVHTWPSIDFNHTGDGKTVAGSTPHLYAAWSAGTTGAGKGIRFKKATYSGGTWSWGTERQIDSTRFINATSRWLNCFFDGTRVMLVGGNLYDGTNQDTVLYERDAADTTTTTYVLHDNISTAEGLLYGSATYDSAGNIYIFGNETDAAGGYGVGFRKWTRAGATYGSRVSIDLDAGSSTAYVSAKRGYSNGRVEFIYTDGSASPYNIKYSYVGEPNYEIATSTASTATAYSNQRKIDRCQNGVVWSMYWDGTATTTTSMRFMYSSDNGATWTDPGAGSAFGFLSTGTTYTPNASFFIDLDDYAHVVYKDRHDGFVYYRRGTPNAGRTTWTWSSATAVFAATAADYPDVVAHREGTGWKAHVVLSNNTSGADRTNYWPVDISSSGTITLGARVEVSAQHGNTVHKYPSLDFNHNGDGKTVAGSTPHLYVAWSAGATGAGKGIRFMKATYSAGTWTWGTEREIDSTRYVFPDGYRWLNCLFDGTRVVIVGQVYTGSADDIVLHDRDAADTTTTTRTLVAGVALANQLNGGSATYDSGGNIFLLGNSGGAAPTNVHYRRWTRATAVFASAVVLDATGPNVAYVSAKRGFSGGKIEFIYTDGTASPYTVTYGSLVLNKKPNAPSSITVTSATIVVGKPEGIVWTHSDPENDPQSKYQIRYRKKTGHPGRSYPRKYPLDYP